MDTFSPGQTIPPPAHTYTMDFWIVEGMAPIPVVTFETTVTPRIRAKKPLIKVEISGDIKILRGKTYPFKDYIKTELKGKWDPKTRLWSIPASVDHAPLLELAANYREPMPSPYTPHLFHGRCCEQCESKDEYYQGPSYLECPVHGKRPTTSRGFGYSGT